MKDCGVLFGVFVFYNVFWHLSAEYFCNAFDFKINFFPPGICKSCKKPPSFILTSFSFLKDSLLS